MNLGFAISFIISSLFFLPQGAHAYCPPFFAEIESISPQYDCLDINDRTKFCGGSIEVINHCASDFYFYDSNGQLDKKLLMINTDKWKGNYEYYNKLEIQQGIEIAGHDYRFEPSYTIQNSEQDMQFKNGDIVKNWEVRLYSIEEEEDIIVKGKTVYEDVPSKQRTSFELPKVFTYFALISLLGIAVLTIILKRHKKF